MGWNKSRIDQPEHSFIKYYTQFLRIVIYFSRESLTYDISFVNKKKIITPIVIFSFQRSYDGYWLYTTYYTTDEN